MFKGSLIPIVTPFKEGKIDEEGFRDLIEFHITNGTDAIVPCGTTGESATLTHEEHEQLIDLSIEAANHRVPVIAGTGSNSTAEAIKLTTYAKKTGADGALLITPYYNKPTQEGLYNHYKAIAEETDLPLILYNVPSRTGVNMLPETVARLSEMPTIVGIKEATGSLRQICDIIHLCGEKCSVFSGDDFTNYPILAVGGKGIISVTANIMPDKIAAMYDAFESGNFDKSRELHYQLLELHNSLFLETNPIPVKTALSLMGKISPEMRPPLSPMSPGNLEILKKVMAKYKLI
ncbi:MAG: 4-hydroxy-tetrahydrodipicolinate synthase [Deltaproteobacteria bacterium]|jgi:4-hydroxy-tetrahydrodipicolinate synthase|nr:4-hydroxy-tetrahydrodipicolinate synthase [Deltaproteobacteria bacterium]